MDRAKFNFIIFFFLRMSLQGLFNIQCVFIIVNIFNDFNYE